MKLCCSIYDLLKYKRLLKHVFRCSWIFIEDFLDAFGRPLELLDTCCAFCVYDLTAFPKLFGRLLDTVQPLSKRSLDI